MQITEENLDAVFRGFKTAFNQGIGRVESQWSRVAMRIPSTGREEIYPWLGQIPGLREWVGDRVINQLSRHGYAIANKDWESTVEVDRNDIEDDRVGLYNPLFQQLGEAFASHPDELVFGLLNDGFNATAYDGQYFFDTDHPVLDQNGNETSVANTDGGSGTPWFLVDDTKAVQPLIYQVRKEGELQRLDNANDPNVFWKNTFIYGVHHRSNVGFGFWQLAWASGQPLNADNYAKARANLQGMKADYGKRLNIRPRLLVVPPSLEGAARQIVNADRDSAGATNVWKDTAQVLVVPWLA